MAQPPHFIQIGEDPAIIGEGVGDLLCNCGQVLVKGFAPANLLAIDVLCTRCGAVTTTPELPSGTSPPSAVIVVDRREEIPPKPATVTHRSVLASREEIDRLSQLYSPRTPDSDRCVIDAATLDAVAADYDGVTDGRLAVDLAAVEAAGEKPVAGLRGHPLAWAIRHLRIAQRDPDWNCTSTDESSVATTLVAAFRHFIACWSHHPLFATMAATASRRGFSLHAAALFGAAKCLADSGNRIVFPIPGTPGSPIAGFYLPISPSERWDVVVESVSRFEWPSGEPWDLASLRSAVLDALAASQARINLRRHGLLVLSAGAVRSAFDQPMVDAINLALQAQGRRHRGVGAVCAILPKFLPTETRNEVRFSFAFYPIPNRHFSGNVAPYDGRRLGTTAV